MNSHTSARLSAPTLEIKMKSSMKLYYTVKGQIFDTHVIQKA